MTFLKENLTNMDLLAKSIRNENTNNAIRVNATSLNIKATDLQWKQFYQNLFLFGGIICSVLSVLLLLLLPIAAMGFWVSVSSRLVLAMVGVLIAAFFWDKIVVRNALVFISLCIFAWAMCSVWWNFNTVNLSFCFSVLFVVLAVMCSYVTRDKCIYLLTITATDILLALILSNVFYLPDYAIAFCIVVFNALILIAMLLINHLDQDRLVFSNWFVSTLLFSFNLFNIYYLYLVNSHLSSIWNIFCIVLDITLMLFYLFVFNYHRNLVNYTIVILTCFFGAFLTLFKFSTSFYSFLLCTSLLIVALKSVVEYLFNLQARWRNLGV